MTAVKAWFERKFETSTSLELLPNLFARLRGGPARLEDLVRSRTPEVLTKRIEGKWSAQEEAGHLLDLEPLWLARVHDYADEHKELTAADLTNRKTHEANHNAHALEGILTEFRAARGKLLAEVSRLDEAAFSRALPHPRLKTPMRLADHLYFVAEHDDHHLARIWDMVKISEASDTLAKS